VRESQAISTPLLQTFVAKMSFLVRRKKKHGAICKGVLKVGSGEAQKDLNSEAQKNATRSLVRRNSDRILGCIWQSFGTTWRVLGGVFVVEFEPKGREIRNFTWDLARYPLSQWGGLTVG
jgi:hypothetical protein